MIAAIEPAIGQSIRQPIGPLPGLVLENLLYVVGAAVALTLLFGFGIWYFRTHRPRKPRVNPSKVYRPPTLSSNAEEPVETPEEPRRRFKYRWRRRKHRHRNPTLAETGGAPASKPDRASNRSAST